MGGHGPDATEIVDAQGTAVEENARAGLAAHSQGRESTQQDSRSRKRGRRAYGSDHHRRDRKKASHHRSRSRDSAYSRRTRDKHDLALTDRRIGVEQKGEMTVLVPGLGHKDLAVITVLTPSRRKSVALVLEAAPRPVGCSRILRRRYINT